MCVPIQGCRSEWRFRINIDRLRELAKLDNPKCLGLVAGYCMEALWEAGVAPGKRQTF
jgi:hypothetical protein